ncbi:ABC transporter substrate-binding protein [Microlunatus soli]|uniref:Peptide/nickel transport system substrate-binding protein n=1 Tax=Microlunatus soli TaxID=630515 RepID=A0A1H1WD56_9ACTN|nr:ABC transporter substrate-binding protein [Microlunatus soli]SDS94306.1 peptide/nickel transport system substrate-binding protein [Microlunatus soli]
MKSRIIAVILALALAVAGVSCSTERTKAPTGKVVDTLKLAMGGATSYTQNFNPFSPAANKSPLMNLIFEPLLRVNRADEMKVQPWLAKSYDFSDDGKKLTFHLQEGVTWSDGKPFTSADVKYTLELPNTTDGLAVAPIPDLDSIETPDEHTVIINYKAPQLHDLSNYSKIPRAIVPKHVWEKQDAVKWTNKEPVTTGAFTLESFSPQSIRLKVRDGYWNGKFNGVKHVEIKPFASEESGKQMLLKNEISWAGMSWQNYQDDFVGADPDHNKYWIYPAGFSTGLLFNMKKGPTNDVHVRRALYAAIDADSLSKLFNSGTKTASPTGLEPDSWGSYLPADLVDVRHQQNVELAKSELKASSYSVKDGKLTKGGKSYPLTMTSNSDDTTWKTFGPAIKKQFKEVLGLDVKVKSIPGQQWARDLGNGDFQMIQQYLLSGDDIWASLNSQLNSEYLKPIGTAAVANQGRYHNAEVDKLLQQMGQTLDEAELKKLTAAITKITTDEVPYAPLHSAAYYVNVNSTDWIGWPDPNSADYIPHITQPVDATITIQHLLPNPDKAAGQ